MNTPPRICAIYVRVSTSGQEEEGTSLQTQEAACRRYAEDNGYAVADAHIYREVYTGAELWERPQLTKLRDAVRRREVDRVIVYAIDRLSRDPVHLGVILTEADHHGAEVRFVTEQLDETPEGQLIQYIRGYAAKVEHMKIKERTQRGLRERVRLGRPLPGGRPPYGYEWRDQLDGDRVIPKARTEPHPVTSAIVRRIYDEASAGRSLRSIAHGLTADGVPTPNGASRWWPATVVYLLRDERYTGTAAAYRYGSEKVQGKYRVFKLPGDERVSLPEGVFPRIVEPEIFAAVQVRLTVNKQQSTRNNRSPELFLLRAGFIRCGLCGYAMAAYSSKRGERTYRCCAATNHRGACRTVQLSARHLDAAVWTRVEEVLTHPQIIGVELRRLQGADPTAADIATVDAGLVAVTKQQERLARRLTQFDDDTAALPVVRELEKLAAEKRRLQAERDDVLVRRAGWESAQRRLADIEAWCRRIAGRVAGMTYEQKREALVALGVDVRLFPSDHAERFTITMSIPVDADPISVQKPGALLVGGLHVTPSSNERKS